jgi:hypothetical protein
VKKFSHNLFIDLAFQPFLRFPAFHPIAATYNSQRPLIPNLLMTSPVFQARVVKSIQRLACIANQFNVAVHLGKSDVTTKLGTSLPPRAGNFCLFGYTCDFTKIQCTDYAAPTHSASAFPVSDRLAYTFAQQDGNPFCRERPGGITCADVDSRPPYGFCCPPATTWISFDSLPCFPPQCHIIEETSFNSSHVGWVSTSSVPMASQTYPPLLHQSQ